MYEGIKQVCCILLALEAAMASAGFVGVDVAAASSSAHDENE